MRILVTLDYYHPHWTGLTVYAKRLAEGLAGYCQVKAFAHMFVGFTHPFCGKNAQIFPHHCAHDDAFHDHSPL